MRLAGDVASLVIQPGRDHLVVRIWDGLEALEASYDIEAVSSPSGVTHLKFTRKAGS